jgi:hypothetical protein
MTVPTDLKCLELKNTLYTLCFTNESTANLKFWIFIVIPKTTDIKLVNTKAFVSNIMLDFFPGFNPDKDIREVSEKHGFIGVYQNTNLSIICEKDVFPGSRIFSETENLAYVHSKFNCKE